jgi:hypothetical protein
MQDKTTTAEWVTSMTPAAQAVRDALGVGDRSIEELRRNTKLPRSTLTAALDELVRAGQARPSPHGGWIPTRDRNGTPYDQIVQEARRGIVADLADGDVFSLDKGETWLTCCTVLWGTVSIYLDDRRDGEAPCVRIEVPRHQRCLIRKVGA